MSKLVRRNVAGLAVDNRKNGDAGAATFAELINPKAREPSYGGGQGGQNTPLHEERKFFRVGVEKLQKWAPLGHRFGNRVKRGNTTGLSSGEVAE